MALNWFGSLRDSSSNFDPKKNFVFFVFFVFFVEKNRTLISDLTQSNFKVLLKGAQTTMKIIPAICQGQKAPPFGGGAGWGRRPAEAVRGMRA